MLTNIEKLITFALVASFVSACGTEQTNTNTSVQAVPPLLAQQGAAAVGGGVFETLGSDVIPGHLILQRVPGEGTRVSIQVNQLAANTTYSASLLRLRWRHRGGSK